MIQPKPATLAFMLRGFFVDYLPRQRALSPHTLCSYRDSIKLLLQFLAEKSGDITKLTVEHFNVTDITAFLQHLETRRHSCTATRNVRLSAIHSFFRFLSLAFWKSDKLGGLKTGYGAGIFSSPT
jgi:integrase/recombinase XerD